MRNQSPGFKDLDDLRYLLKVLYISWQSTWASLFPHHKHIDTWIRQASQLLLSDAHTSTTLTWTDAEEQYRGLVKFLTALTELPEPYRVETQPAIKQIDQWWSSLPKVGKMVASNGVLITSVDLPLKQGSSGLEKQHAVLFEGITTQLSADAVELVTGILPESVESCEEGLIVKLKSQEEHDKMLELSGHIVLKQGKVIIKPYSSSKPTASRYVFTITFPGATITDARNIAEIVLNLQLITEPIVSANGVIEYEVTPESAVLLRQIQTCFFKGAPRKIEEKVVEAAVDVPDAIIYGIPEGLDEAKIVASLELMVDADMTGKVKYLEQQQLVILYKPERNVDWFNLSLVLRGKKVVVAPFSQHIVKLSNIPIDLYTEDKLTAKLAEDVPANTIQGVYLDAKNQTAYVHLKTAEAKDALVKKEIIEIGFNLESKSSYVELRVINLPPSTRISEIVKPLGRLISARIGTVRVDEDTHTAFVPVPSNVVQRALDLQHFMVNNKQVQIIADVDSSTAVTITFKTPAMVRYLQRFAKGELETIKQNFSVDVEGIDEEPGMHIRLVNKSDANRVLKAKDYLKRLLDTLVEEKIQLNFPARYTRLFGKVVALINVPCASIVKEKMSGASTIKVYLAGKKDWVGDFTSVIKTFKTSIVEDVISLNGNQRDYIEKDYTNILAPYADLPIDMELQQNTVRISGIGSLTTDVITFIRDTLEEKFYKIVLKEKPTVTPARLHYLLLFEQENIRQFIKAKSLLSVKHYINPVVNSITLSGQRSQVKTLEEELKQILESIISIQFSFAADVNEAHFKQIDGWVQELSLSLMISLSYPAANSKSVAIICGREEKALEQFYTSLEYYVLSLLPSRAGSKALIRHPTTQTAQPKMSSTTPNTKSGGISSFQNISGSVSLSPKKDSLNKSGSNSPVRLSFEKKAVPINQLYLEAIAPRQPMTDNKEKCYHHHCPKCREFHHVEVRFTCPTCRKLMTQGKLSTCEITASPKLTWGDLVNHKQKLLCEYGDIQSYLLQDLSEMNQKASKFNEVMGRFPALKSLWGSHSDFQTSFTILREMHNQYIIEFYCANCTTALSTTNMPEPVYKFDPQTNAWASFIQTLHNLLISLEIRRDYNPRVQPGLPDLNQHLKLKEMELKNNQLALKVSGITDMTLSVVNTRLHDASLQDFIVTELHSRYVVKHLTADQLQRYREFGRVLGYAMVNRGSTFFSAALPLWKYITNRPITTVDLYFMFPTLYDNLLRILPVQSALKYDLAKIIAKWKLYDEVEAGLKEIATGLFEVIPAGIIERLSPQELEERINGPFKLEYDEFRRYIQFEGAFAKQPPQQDKFWGFFNSVSQTVRQKVLYCMSGQLRLIPEQKYIVESKSADNDQAFVPKQRKLLLPPHDNSGAFDRSVGEIMKFINSIT
eukprot:TRINITY_DN2809_c0_g1_i2.p2 TRINITY_DN2809_c0_g1~~TRINITY_DN2809_c0_g1_i2.p2  ORF type:complete len:1408 (+),score=297.66 TRINITY_DN2809_c0_g1_i2:4614-8837(+)